MGDTDDIPACSGATIEQETFLNLVRSHECLLSEQSRFFQQFGITAQQFNVLRVLRACPDQRGFACQAIAEKLLNRVPDITRLLDRLEQAGFIQRFRCSSDRRVVRTQLTDDGRAKADTIEAPFQEELRKRFSHMGAGEVQELNRLLLKAREGGCTGAAPEIAAAGTDG